MYLQGNSRRRHNEAFTLVELLVVVAVILILMALVVPAFTGIGRGKDFSRALQETSDVIEQARSHSMARNTWTFVEFQQPVEDQVDIRVFESIDQSADSAQTNRRQLNKTQHLKGVALTKLPDLGQGRPQADEDVVPPQMIAISPLGAATIDSSANLTRWIEIGVQGMRGSVALPAERAVIQVAGLTGQTQTFRQ